ncbi:unnamed protein product [Durusdinium trenchii]|uniref:Uncharacterized protein n=1 Tax=Durusdinium trenchii TaxID=1381693 RepID=A0ABP0KF14_9DINO
MPSSSESRPRRVRSRSSRRRSRSDRRRSPPRRRDSRDRRDRRDSRDRRPSPRDRRSRSRERPERPASRSRSRKRPTVTPGGGIETVEVKVVDARTRHSGEQTFQAEIYLGLDAAAAEADEPDDLQKQAASELCVSAGPAGWTKAKHKRMLTRWRMPRETA